VLDADTIRMVAAEYDVEVLDRDEEGVEAMARKTVDYFEESDLEFLQPRPPVVTVMGHVDHGKVGLITACTAYTSTAQENIMGQVDHGKVGLMSNCITAYNSTAQGSIMSQVDHGKSRTHD
jgi:translation initiation factor IF-2